MSGPAPVFGRVPRRTAVVFAATTAVGIASFAWPLVVRVSQSQNGAHAADAPVVLAVLLPLLFVALHTEVSDGLLDAKAIALLGILAGCGCALRVPSPGVAGFEPMFFLLLPAGRVFGRGFGFVLGALTVVTSALVTAGVGPWLPFQMIAAGWVGLGAGCLPRRLTGRGEVAALTAYGALAGLAYGALMNLWFWPLTADVAPGVAYRPGAGVLTNLHHFIVFDATTSLGFDLPRAATTALLMAVLGRPVLAALRRAARRARFGVEPAFVRAGAPDGG